MVKKKSWETFRKTRMLWLINRTLHIFGWAILLKIDEKGKVIDAFPARVKFRGFDAQSESDGFIGISKFMEKNAKQLRKESELK